MCNRFIESIGNKVIEYLTCPCEPKNFTLYNSNLCEMLSNIDGEQGINIPNENIENIYVDVLISCLHHKELLNFSIIFGYFKNYMNEKIKNKILSHIKCYDFNDMYVFYNSKHKLNQAFLTFNSCPNYFVSNKYADWKRITFVEWFNYFFKKDNSKLM